MRRALLIAATLLLCPAVASAHRDDYIDETFVYMTLGRHEFEIEAWGEARRGLDHATVDWYTGAFEYGLTSRWMVDGAAQAMHDEGATSFGRLRLESRVRFADEGRWPVDVAASAEYEHETSAATGRETEDVITPRLVLSRDVFRDLNTTVNLDLPIAVGGEVEFAYALGMRYPAETTVRVGAEWKGTPAEKTSMIFPQVWLALPHEITFKVGSGIGLTSSTDEWVVRGALEIEL